MQSCWDDLEVIELEEEEAAWVTASVYPPSGAYKGTVQLKQTDTPTKF